MDTKKTNLLKRIKDIIDESIPNSKKIVGAVPMLDKGSTESANALPLEHCLAMCLLAGEIISTAKSKAKSAHEHNYVTWARKCTNNMAWLSYFGYTCFKRIKDESFAYVPAFKAQNEITGELESLGKYLFDNFKLFEKAQPFVTSAGITIDPREEKTPFPQDTPTELLPGKSTGGWNTRTIWTRWYAENLFDVYGYSIRNHNLYNGAREAMAENGPMFRKAV